MAELNGKTQKGVLLHRGQVRCSEVPVPAPPLDHNKINPASIRKLLPECDPEHLLLADSPFSGLVGQPMLLVYDASSQLDPNPCAMRLTTNLDDGLEVKICGDAVAFYTQPGLDFTPAKWAELDNCIYEELVSVYEKGQRPGEDELKRIVREFRAGRFNYGRQEGEEDEDANKDDGGKDLQEAMEGAGAPKAAAAAAAAIPRPPSGVDWRPLVAEGHPGLV